MSVFRRLATPRAQRLAVILSASPAHSIESIKLTQQHFVPHSGASELAELLLARILVEEGGVFRFPKPVVKRLHQDLRSRDAFHVYKLLSTEVRRRAGAQVARDMVEKPRSIQGYPPGLRAIALAGVGALASANLEGVPPAVRLSTKSQARSTRRQEIIEAAFRALSDVGPDFSLDHVCTEANVRKSTVYRQFLDREDLIDAMAKIGVDELLSSFASRLAPHSAPLSQIRQLVSCFFEWLDDRPHLYLVIVRYRPGGDEAVRSVALYPSGGDEAFRALQEAKSVICSMIYSKLVEVFFDLDVNNEAVEAWSQGLVGLVLSIADWWLERRSMSSESVVEYVSQIVWSGMDGLFKAHGIWLDPHLSLTEQSGPV